MTTSRRDFLKSAAVAGTVVAVGSLIYENAEAVLPSVDKDLNGIIEMHVHAAPDVRNRSIDQLNLARQFRQNGYRAVMFKCHDFCTADNAYLLSDMVPGLDVFGGIALNLNYGPKVNVQAAKMATQLTGGRCRCIWMPTYQSAYDMKRAGKTGVPILDGAGKVLPEVVKVMELCRDEDIIFATGHSSPEECVTLSAKAKEVGVKKFVVTHCTQTFWFLTKDQAMKCLENGAYLEHSILPYYNGEHCLVPAYQKARQTKLEEIVEYIKLDPSHQFISSDLGMSKMPNPVDGMLDCLRGLRKAGLADNELDIATRKVPAYLLGLK